MTEEQTNQLQDARDEEVRRGRELLVAAQRYYDGELSEDDFIGAVCRYGHACLSRRVLRHEFNVHLANTNGLN